MRIQAIDSHTGGEPTRVILDGQLDLRGETMAKRRADFEARFDQVRSGLINEPRGSDVWVGAALTPPVTPGATAGMIFFNNVGYLGMCGHGTIGVVETLRHLGRIGTGEIVLDTPVGVVSAKLQSDGGVQLQNVVSYRYADNVSLDVPGLGRIVGDIAYGGNWFFLVHEPTFDISLANARELTAITWRIRETLEHERITGSEGAEIDHIELFGASRSQQAQSRNFVLCPGGAYDRSPCGTGTSAKLACLHAAGKLKSGEWYGQESVTGSVFLGKVEAVEGGVTPTIVGRAHVTAETTFIFGDDDPIRWGLSG